MVTNIQIQQFLLLFKGKSNTYVHNELPLEMPPRGEKTKTVIKQCQGEVNQSIVSKHLNGTFALGVCPVMSDGKCTFGVIDFDYYKGKIRHVLDVIREHSLPLIPFRSKSGGLHCYLMLTKAVKASVMRETLNSIIQTFSFDKIYGAEHVEVFPKQDRVSEDGFGSAITLPYFNGDDTYTYMLNLDGSPVRFGDALGYIQKHLVPIERVKEVLDDLPYNDAPPCIQRILLSGLVGGDDTGRNNFLFAFAVYAAKKYGDGYADKVFELNDSFETPLERGAVEATINSIKQKEYSYPCKNIPCSAYCNKSTCKEREYGLGRDKGHFSDVEYGQLYRYQAEEPYYIWQLRLQGSTEPFKNIMFKDEAELLDQKNFARACVRYLNFAPRQVQTNDWFSTLNKHLAHVQNVSVSEESDTSVTSTLKRMFIRYLANKQARRDSPYQIHANLCVRQTFVADDGSVKAKFFFTHLGFTEFLKNSKVTFDTTTLRETLKRFGAVEDVLRYSNIAGKQIEFSCWSVLENDAISNVYKSEVEIAEGDKAHFESVSEANNSPVEEAPKEQTTTLPEDFPDIYSDEVPF